MNPAEFDSIIVSEETHWWFQGQKGILFDLIETATAGRAIHSVLECGCGTGYLALEMQRRFGWKVTGLDASSRAVHMAQGRGLSELTQGDASILPFPDNCFDAVISMDVLVHFPPGGEAAALAEFYRVLKPGGALFLRVSALDILRSRHSEFVEEKQRFTRSGLHKGVSKCGFQVDRATYANSLLMPVALFKFRIWEPLMQPQASTGTEPLAPWLNWILGRPLALERAILRTGLSFPVGQSLLIAAHKPEI